MRKEFTQLRAFSFAQHCVEEGWQQKQRMQGLTMMPWKKRKKAKQFPDFEPDNIDPFQDTGIAQTFLQETRVSRDGMGDSN